VSPKFLVLVAPRQRKKKQPRVPRLRQPETQRALAQVWLPRHSCLIRSSSIYLKSVDRNRINMKRCRPRGDSASCYRSIVVLNPELQRIQNSLQALLDTTKGKISLIYLAINGNFGYPRCQAVLGSGRFHECQRDCCNEFGKLIL